MRILHLDSGPAMRGGQWQALRLLEGLARACCDVLLLAPAQAPLLAAARDRALPAEPLSLRSLARRSRHADLIHAHDARSHLLAALLKRAPLIAARRVAFPVARSPLSRWKYARADHFIAVSDCARRTLLDAGIPADKISVVYDGVPVPAIPACGDRILALASSDPRKCPGLLRQAAALAGVPLDLSTDLDRDLRRAAIFLYLTEQEGLGSAVLLAMAAGVAVIASRTGGLPEIIEHEHTGLLTENSPQAVAAALARLHKDPALRRRLGEQARRRVLERFTDAHMVEATLAVYRKVLACPKPS
jgi:glycosyltransferase involved in cell wall biosynthesis